MDFELDDRQFHPWVDFAYNNDKSILSDETKIERVSTETKEVLIKSFVRVNYFSYVVVNTTKKKSVMVMTNLYVRLPHHCS